MKNMGREQEMSQDVVINKILIIFICVLLQRTMDVPYLYQVCQIFNCMLREHLEHKLTS